MTLSQEHPLKTLISSALLTLALAAPAWAGDLKVENAWARATPKGAAVGGAYFTLRNDGAAADRLTQVSVDFAKAEVHEMKMNKGVMEMRTVSGGLEIPAHATVALKPGGYHLMLVGLKHPLVKGESFKATLTFEHACAVTVDVPVTGIGAAGPASGDAMKGMKM
jgi:copper(I)-binding protein